MEKHFLDEAVDGEGFTGAWYAREAPGIHLRFEAGYVPNEGPRARVTVWRDNALCADERLTLKLYSWLVPAKTRVDAAFAKRASEWLVEQYAEMTEAHGIPCRMELVKEAVDRLMKAIDEAPKLPVEQWRRLKYAADEISSAMNDAANYRLKYRCSHKYKDGTDATHPCGGGESWCPTCRTQLD